MFENKKTGVLNVYCTAGYPMLNSTLTVISALDKYGADIIELGMPYSDPLADGPVIQESSAVALQNGMNLHRLFEQLAGLRQITNLPVILMGYLNPVLKFGVEAFCQAASEAGIDGLIIPDIPIIEFEKNYGHLFKKYNLDFIFLVTPETPADRVKKLDALSSGFLYAVSSSSTTGSEKQMIDIKSYLKRLQSYQLKNPVLMGFGIKDKAGFEMACEHAQGAIIGSAYIKAIGKEKDLDKATAAFLSSILVSD